MELRVDRGINCERCGRSVEEAYVKHASWIIPSSAVSDAHTDVRRTVIWPAGRPVGEALDQLPTPRRANMYRSKLCRERHLKCDRAAPVCSSCLKSGRDQDCSYEGLRIRHSGYSAKVKSNIRRYSQDSQPLSPPPTSNEARTLSLQSAPEPNQEVGATSPNTKTYRRISLQTVISPLGSGPQPFSPQGFSPQSVQNATSPASFIEIVTDTRADYGRRRESLGGLSNQRKGSREEVPRRLVNDNLESTIFEFYIKQAGPWVSVSRAFQEEVRLTSSKLDIVSPARHFGQTVPRIALREPVLYYACLAYSAHVMSLMGKLEKSVEELYQNKAIGLLIPMLSSQSEPWKDEILLATTVILRMSEQFSEVGDDARHHLNGAFSLFGTSDHRWSPFQTDVRGVAFWIYLRESIRVCFLHEQGCQFNMGLIEDEMLIHAPDEVWANRMTYLLAQTCNACWGNTQTNRRDELARVQLLIEEWKGSLPETFKEWGYFQGSEPFPKINHLSTWHGKTTCPLLTLIGVLKAHSVIGWQQYYTAKVMFAIYAKPHVDSSYLAINQYMQVSQWRPFQSVLVPADMHL